MGAQYNPKVIRTLKLKNLSEPYKWYSCLGFAQFCIPDTNKLISSIKIPSQVG